MTTTEALIRAGQAYMAAACSGNLAGAVDAMRAALAQQPAASGEPATPVAWAQLGMRNGHTYVRMHYEGHLYPPPPDVQRNLNLVPLYATAQPAPARVPLTDERLNAAGLDYALADSFTGKGEWVAQDIADAFKAGARAAERYYAATPAQGEPK